MADFKDERAYNSRTLTQWFLWSSLALLVCVAWMAWADYDRPWKHYQRKFMKMERKRAAEGAREAGARINGAELLLLQGDEKKKINGELQKAEKEADSHQKEIRRLESKTLRLKGEIYKFNLDYQVTKANIDKEKFEYSEYSLKAGKENPGEKKKIEKLIAKADALTQKLFTLKADRKQAEDDLAAIYAKKTEVEVKIKSLTKDFEFLKAKVQNLRPTFRFGKPDSWGPFVLYQIRDAMFLDFLAPSITIKQIVLQNLPDDLYFAKTQRVDRCTSCHLSIDKKGYEDAAQPFRTHPRLDLYLGSTSPHSIDKIGCTVCHGGVGQALDFTMCAHVPNDEKQAKRWSKKFNWHEPHGIEGPMVPLRYTEGSCLKCHGLQQHVNFAPKLNRGRELMVTRGCVGCHKVKNLEGLTKAGPSLLKVKGKLKKEFVEKWVWNPTSFNPKARMPAFFNQSNNQDADGQAKNKAELKALVGLLYDDLSGEYSPSSSPGPGSASRGKKLFHDVGCAACHGIDDVTALHADFAPDLSGSGSKLSASWIYTWIRNPHHYDPNTRMPSLRLSETEASDITAYLMSKRNKDFEESATVEADPAVRDTLIQDYLKPQVGLEGAKTQLASMDEKAKNQFLGKKTLNKYGCFGCHTIQGYETASGIGTELSEWHSKRVNQLDFGFMDYEHTHAEFLVHKLENPRVYDTDKVVAFQDRLKMPNFHLSEEDRESIAVAVLGLSKTYIPEGMTAGIGGNGPLLEKGRRVIEKFNCRGCHILEDQGGRIRELFKQEGRENFVPPDLKKIGARTQMEFLHSFFLAPKQIRRNLNIRMPSFQWSDEDLSSLITYMNLKEDQVFPFKEVKTHRLSGQDYEDAQSLFKKLQCAKCHMVQGRPPADPASTAPELANVRHRLKPDWVVEWLKNPGALMKDTPMPSFWPEGAAADPKLFGGDGLKQREAIRDYLFMLGQSAE